MVMSVHLVMGTYTALSWGFRNEIMRCDGDASTEEEELGPDDGFFVWVFWPWIDHGEGRIFRMRLEVLDPLHLGALVSRKVDLSLWTRQAPNDESSIQTMLELALL